MPDQSAGAHRCLELSSEKTAKKYTQCDDLTKSPNQGTTSDTRILPHQSPWLALLAKRGLRQQQAGRQADRQDAGACASTCQGHARICWLPPKKMSKPEHKNMLHADAINKKGRKAKESP